MTSGTEKKSQQNVSEFYNDAMKYWMDMSNNWMRMMGGTPPTAAQNMQSWFRPFASYVPGMASSTPQPFVNFMQYFNEMSNRNISSFFNSYNAWLKGLDSITRETLQANQKMAAGQKVDTDRLYNAIRDAYMGVTTAALESFKGTPIEGLTALCDAIKKTIDAMPEGQQSAREYFQRVFNVTSRMANLATSSATESAQIWSAMLEKGQVSGDDFKKLIENSSESLKSYLDAFQLPTELASKSESLEKDAADWTKANVNLFTSFLEMYVNFYRAMASSAAEVYKASDEAMKQGKVATTEDVYKVWSDTSKKAADSLVQNTQVSDSVRKIMTGYDEWLKSMEKLSQRLVNIPSAAGNGHKVAEETQAKARDLSSEK